ncbi:MAG TPA: biopolymer transporter ExbD [Candidatus Krumholzibacteria bacterium]|nr:biopolymer transporter ExbD [Candidatus Krumholzibacteria bacterium]
MRRGGRFRSTIRALDHIPTESMADIAFLLLIFYLTSAILRSETGLVVDLPRARNTLRQPREQIAHIWIDKDGRAMINDLYVEYEEVAPILAAKLRENPDLIVAVNTDRRTRYRYMQRALEELKKAETVRVSFTTVPIPSGP